jgi:hypothetical protein
MFGEFGKKDVSGFIPQESRSVDRLCENLLIAAILFDVPRCAEEIVGLENERLEKEMVLIHPSKVTICAAPMKTCKNLRCADEGVHESAYCIDPFCISCVSAPKGS